MAEKDSMTYISAEDVSVGYHDLPLIEKINLYVNRGEILTLIGPNGAGKSTILKSIIGQLKLVKGEVWLDGSLMGAMKEKDIALRMSVMMTGRVKTERMTCQEVVSMGRYPYTGKMGILTEKDWQVVHDSLKLVQGLELAEKDFETVSDGQRQRVLLARAICQEPQVIVLDEPTAFLDIRHKLELLYLLKNMVREKQVAVLMSLHELDLAQKISDHIICVKGDNSIGRFGTPEEIFRGDYIKELFQIERGSYLTDYGSVELEAVKGEPKVFVIGGNGAGIPVYRQLQKQGIPFAAGILWENDREYPVAETLASVVIREKAFEPVSDTVFEAAVRVLKNCEKVICCLENFGTYQEPCRQLWKIAENLDIIVPFGYNTVIVKSRQNKKKKPVRDRFEEAFYSD